MNTARAVAWRFAVSENGYILSVKVRDNSMTLSTLNGLADRERAGLSEQYPDSRRYLAIVNAPFERISREEAPTSTEYLPG
jgi:hypothetical protein